MDIPRHMAIAGHLAPDLAARLDAEAPELETRVVGTGDLTPGVLDWADSYCGFSIPGSIAGSRVRWVHLMSDGVDGALPALRGLDPAPLLTHTVGSLPQKIAAYVVCHVLDEFQRVDEFRVLRARRGWAGVQPESQVGKTAVVLGTGRVGSAVAVALKALAFRVVGVSRGGGRAAPFDAVAKSGEAEDEYRSAAVVVCTLPLTEETRHLVDAKVFEIFEGAVFVNVGRGATVVEADLRAALDTGRVRAAVLDVFETEPVPADSWVWDHERVVVTPHIAGVTDVEDVLGELLSAYERLRAGERPGNSVDLVRGY